MTLIQPPWHKVSKYLGKRYKVIGMIYWDNGRIEAVMSKGECHAK